MGKKLIIVGADFSNSAVELSSAEKVENEIRYAEFLPGVSVSCSYNTVSGQWVPVSNNARGTILVPSNKVLYQTPWVIGDTPSPVIETYDAIALEPGAKTVTLRMTNNAFYYGLVIGSATHGSRYDSGWKLGGTEITLNVSAWSDEALFVHSTFKKGSAGSEAVPSDTTIQSVGWECIVEY